MNGEWMMDKWRINKGNSRIRPTGGSRGDEWKMNEVWIKDQLRMSEDQFRMKKLEWWRMDRMDRIGRMNEGWMKDDKIGTIEG